MVTPAARREAVKEIRESWPVSERRACVLVGISREVLRYAARRKDEPELLARIRALAHAKPRYGYRRIGWLLRRQGATVNHKRVYRIYRREGLTVRKRARRKLCAIRRPAPAAEAWNDRWSMDFMQDALFDGRKIRLFNVVDDWSRECLAIEVDRHLPGERVKDVLSRLCERRGKPRVIVSDNGSEFTGRVLTQWATEAGIELHFIRPGKPIENCFVESFNGKVREECLNENWFLNLDDARQGIEKWRHEYNHDRPHSALGNAPPAEFAALRRPTASSGLQTPKGRANQPGVS
jgi:putative transposase